MITIVVGGVDYSERVVDCKVHKNETWLGNIAPNEATIDLDNSDGFFQIANLPSTDDNVIISIDGKRQFTGFVNNVRLNVRSKTVRIQATDFWKKFEKRYCQNTVFLSTPFLIVLQQLIQMGGEDLVNTELEDPGLTISYWHIDEDMKVRDAIEELVQSVGGQIYYNEYGVLVFKAGFKSPFSTDIVDTIEISSFRDLNNRKKTAEATLVEVKCKLKQLSDEILPVYIGATSDEPFNVPAAGWPDDPDDEFWVEFEKPVWWLCPYDQIAFDADDGITLDQATYEENFLDLEQGILKNPKRIKLKINNSSGADGSIYDFRIFGKFVEEEESVAVHGTGEPAEKFTLESEIISDMDWAKQLAQWLYEEKQERVETEMEVVEFSKALNYHIGDKLQIVELESGIDNRFRISEMDIDYKASKITLKLISDRGEEFQYIGSRGKRRRRGEKPRGDGLPPAPPSNLQLSSYLQDGFCFVRASWDHSTSPDVRYYIVKWSYDQTNWSEVYTPANSVAIMVQRNTTVYVQVATYDLDGLVSEYISASVESISAGQPEPPLNLRLSTYMRDNQAWIYAQWDPSPSLDVSHYLIRWSYDQTTWYTLTTKGTSIEFSVKQDVVVYVRVSAVNIEGIESDYIQKSITSANDTEPPPAPSTMAVYPGVGLIVITWSKVTVDDFSHYLLERAYSTTSQYPTNFAPIAMLESAIYVDRDVSYDTYYRYRIKAVDKQGNESPYLTMSTGLKPKKAVSIDIDAEVITETHIADNSISSPKIKANAIRASHIAAEQIQSEHIESNAILAQHIAANQITANHLTAAIDLGVGKQITVGSLVKIGYQALPDGSDGIYVEGGAFQLKNDAGTVVIDGKSNMFKIHYTGYVYVGGGATATINFSDLGYKPIFLFYVQASNIEGESNVVAQWPIYCYYIEGLAKYEWGFKAWTYTNYIRIRNFYSSGKWLRFYILKEIAM